MLKNLKSDLKKLSSPAKAKIMQGFFKTGKGEYGEGDIFLGITVPLQRQVAKKYADDLSMADLDKLIRSSIHEHRLIALLVLVSVYQRTSLPAEALAKAGTVKRKQIYNFYLSHTKQINNWDLVDLSADKIVGAYLQNRDKSVLIGLAKSPNLWERRIAMLATFHYIKKGDAMWTIKIAQMLLTDKHDLIHKAVGWMLREVGKRCSEKKLMSFLNKHRKIMPRTSLRYAIERLPQKLKNKYLASG